MMLKILLVLLIILKIIIAIGRDGPCTTPNNERSACVPIRNCDVILNAVSSKDAGAIEFAQKSQCGYDSQPLVCCGSSGNFLATRTLDGANKLLPDRTVCGLEKGAERVIGGEVTDVEEFPWLVALEYRYQQNGNNAGIKCGGSLINNRYVLTAAHCIIHVELEIRRAWLGEWKLSSDPDCQALIAFNECADPVLKLKLEQQIPHPHFSLSSGKNDIGLLRLEENVIYTDYIRPICLPSQDLLPNDRSAMTVAGWGTTENGKPSDVKLKVIVPLVSIEDCSKKLRREVTVDQLCAGAVGGKDSCTGDSGGPLMKPMTNSSKVQWYLEGIVSWGVGCGRIGYPAIYTRVFKYMSWIMGNLR